MPRDVNTDQRLADIAAATIAVARTAGAHAVTIRSVAKQLGGSTTLVTNYLPSRAALILNALDQGKDRWRQEFDEAVSAARDVDRLTAVIDWSLTSTTDDPVLRTLILEIVANASVEPTMRESLARESDGFRTLLESAAVESGFEHPEHVAEVVYLMVRGAYIASTEDPERWDEAHIRSVIQATLATQPRVSIHQRTT